MNLAGRTSLDQNPETRVWFRAIEARFGVTALQTEHTRGTFSRFNPGSLARRAFQVLYLCEDHQVALHEVEAMFGSPFPRPGRVVVPTPQQTWTILNVRVRLQRVASLEGFLAVSAKLPNRMILVVFPEKLLRGSEVVFTDGTGQTHRIDPPPRTGRR